MITASGSSSGRHRQKMHTEPEGMGALLYPSCSWYRRMKPSKIRGHHSSNTSPAPLRSPSVARRLKWKR